MMKAEKIFSRWILAAATLFTIPFMGCEKEIMVQNSIAPEREEESSVRNTDSRFFFSKHDREGNHAAPPIEIDTDGDGVSDSVENELGSDANNPFSWPGNGVWPDRSGDATLDGVVGTTFGIGEVLPNFVFLDQLGQEVELTQFYGQTILMVFLSQSCGICIETAASYQDCFENLREDGLVILHVLVKEVESEATPQAWAAAFGLTFPVLGGTAGHEYWNLIKESPFSPTAVPFFMLIDKDMKLVFTQEGFTSNPGQLELNLYEQLYGAE